MPNLRRHPQRKPVALLVTVVAATVLPAGAQQPPSPVHHAVTDFLQQQTAGLPGKVDVTIEQFDPRNQLPPCARITPFLPAGTRAWGQINVGVRCESPVTWTAWLPARVSVTGEYLVTARAIRAGQIISPSDIERRTGDLAAEAANTLTDAAQAIGHPARYTVAAGSTLKADMLRLPLAVRQGQTVKILGIGTGFTVANEGRALNAAGAGEPVRVRLGNGQVVTGRARADGAVEVDF